MKKPRRISRPEVKTTINNDNIHYVVMWNRLQNQLFGLMTSYKEQERQHIPTPPAGNVVNTVLEMMLALEREYKGGKF